MTSPFDAVNSITYTKELVITRENVKEYNPYLTNTSLSYFPDTLEHAVAMDRVHFLDPLLQHDYLFYSVKRKKRFSKWFKRERFEEIIKISDDFGYGYTKAAEAYRVLKSLE